MLNVFRCPNCEKKLKTDQVVGQSIPCPYCKEVFTISEEDAYVPDPTRELLIKLAIPLGYVLFVAVPLGLTLLYFATRDEKKPVADTPVVKNEKKPAPAPRPRKEKGAPVPGGPANPDPDPDPDPETMPPTTPMPTVPTPPVPKVQLAIAPPPRRLPDPDEVFVVPEPREVLWNLPTLYDSPWQKVGSVDLRLARVAVGRVPIIDGKEQVRDSAQPMLVLVIEVRANAGDKKRELQSWTHGRFHYSVAFAGGKDLLHPDLPLGSRVHSVLPLKQPLPADGEPVRDILVFTAPPDGAGEVSVRLDGDRCGETGDIWFKIPAAALKK